MQYNTRSVHSRLLNLTYISLAAALMAVCAWISFPVMALPVTMQTFGVFCAVGLLGGKRGTLSVLVYILLGAIGLPVFTGFSGGIGQLLGVTGGYITGFLFLSLTMWLFSALFPHNKGVFVFSMLLGLLLCYLFGTAWYVFLYQQAGQSVGWIVALQACVFPFILPDLLKMLLALSLIRTIKKHLPEL